MAIDRRRLIGLAVTIAIAVAAAYAYFEFGQMRTAPSTEIVLYGNVDIREADLAFNVAGRIETMHVEEGDEIREGQLLATLESETYKAEVDAARARLAAQQAVLGRLVAGSRPEEIREARADVQAIAADLDDARANLLRTENLAKRQDVSQRQLDQDRARVKGLQARLKGAEQRLALVVQGPRAEDIAEARAQAGAREAELALALHRLAYTNLVAEDRGVIKTRITEPGSVVLAQAPVYTLALTDPVWVRTYVSEPDLGRTYPNMEAHIFTDSAPQKAYVGWVGYTSPTAEFTPKTVETPEIRTNLVYRVRIYVRNPDNGLRQGMPVTIRLKTRARGGDGEKAPSEQQ